MCAGVTTVRLTIQVTINVALRVLLRGGRAACLASHAKHIIINWQSVRVSILGLNAIFVQCAERKSAVIVVKLDMYRYTSQRVFDTL